MENKIRSLPNISHFANKIEEKVRRRIFKQKMAEQNAFGSHLPILLGISRIIQPKSILELGPGLFSTPMFNNMQFFPELTNFTCIESELEWFEKCKTFFVGNDNAQLILADSKVADFIQTINTRFDLIFIDDSLTTEDRVRSIQNVSVMANIQNTIVVVHDFEVPDYQRATERFENRYIFKCFRPHTGVVWNNSILTYKKLENMERSMYRLRWKYPVLELNEWWNKLYAGN